MKKEKKPVVGGYKWGRGSGSRETQVGENLLKYILFEVGIIILNVLLANIENLKQKIKDKEMLIIQQE